MAVSESFVSIKKEEGNDTLSSDDFPPLPSIPMSQEDLVRNAIRKNDWEALRELSCRPLGFRSVRKEAWFVLYFRVAEV